MTLLDDLIDTATTAYFIMQNSVPDIKQLSYAAVLSETIEKIQKLLNCTGFDAMKLVKTVLMQLIICLVLIRNHILVIIIRSNVMR